MYRERSIDDGSLYDPHLDKYSFDPMPMTGPGLLRRSQTHLPLGQSHLEAKDNDCKVTTTTTATIPAASATTTTIKRGKKLGGFEKVKQLFSGVGGGSGGGDKKDAERKSNSSTTSSSAGTQQTLRPKHRDKYMVNEDEMRSRYREHRGSDPVAAANLSHGLMRGQAKVSNYLND